MLTQAIEIFSQNFGQFGSFKVLFLDHSVGQKSPFQDFFKFTLDLCSKCLGIVFSFERLTWLYFQIP